jgi:hypothetical protein
LGAVVAAFLAGMAISLPLTLPILPAGDVHHLPAAYQHSSDLGDTIGWPQLTRAVAAQDTALVRAGQPPTSIFTGYYAEAGALDVLGSAYHLPPVLSGHNAYWMWGPGRASDRTVLVVDALGQLRTYFASCRLLTTYYAPYHVQNELDRPADRRLHRPAGQLASAMAAPEALRLTAPRLMSWP